MSSEDAGAFSSTGSMPPWFTPLTIGVLVVVVLLGTLPSLNGEYGSGDDIKLVRDNVLVNHPSFKHALQLFLVPAHRDLYQPVALLSFQIDFALGGLLTFRGDSRVIHAHNIAFHALNAVLVFLFLRQWTRRPVVAAPAGLLMAAHPINIEAVAWVNGRMMLQSTCYFLLGLMCFEHWRRLEGRRRWGWLGLALFLFIWTMLSKVRVELPGILILLLVLQRVRPRRSWCAAWIVVTAITAAFSAYALFTTNQSAMFDTAAQEMRGPRPARAFQSLAWYFQHYVWPTGLGPWHPPVEEVAWADRDTLLSVGIVCTVWLCVAMTWRGGRTGVVGMLWFLGGIFSTLQIVASRAILAAERYVYLPGIGLHWLVAAGFVWFVVWLSRRIGRQASMALAGAVLVAVVGLFVRVGRQTCSYYRDSVAMAQRVVELYPDVSDVFVDLAWAYIRAGEFEKGIECAREQFNRPEHDACSIYQAIAWARYSRGELEQAQQSLLKARDANPKHSKVYYRLGKVHLAQKRFEDAEREFRHSVELTPLYLPAQTELASLYLQQGRLDEAEAQYRTILDKVNPHDPESRYNLAEIHLRRGDYELARQAYEQLLAYMPEHAEARANLGLCLQRLGDADGAMREYNEALRREPGLHAARLNRAALLIQLGRMSEAEAECRTILSHDPAQREALDLLSSLLRSAGRSDDAPVIWEAATTAEPGSADLLAGWAWALSLSSTPAAAMETAQEALAKDSRQTLATLARGIAYLRGGQVAESADVFEQIARERFTGPAEVLSSAMGALGELSAADPDSPWPYYFTSLLLAAEGRMDAAGLGLAEFKNRCRDPEWIQRAEETLDGVDRTSP